MPLEELLTRWTIRVSLALYAAALGTTLMGRSRLVYLREARLVWTTGCVMIWLHIAAAFHFYHGWSHQAAYEATARDTELTIGWAFGGGVYVNYVFAVVWTVDVACWWMIGLKAYVARSGWLKTILHSFLLFVVFNSTVTFGDGALRWMAAAGFGALAILGSIRLRRLHSAAAAVSSKNSPTPSDIF